MPRIAKILAAALAAFCAAFASADTFLLADYAYTEHYKAIDEAADRDTTRAGGASLHVFGDVFYGSTSFVLSKREQIALRAGATRGSFTPYISYSEMTFHPDADMSDCISRPSDEPDDEERICPRRSTTHVVDFGLFYALDDVVSLNFTRSVGNADRTNYGVGFLGGFHNNVAFSMQLNSKRGFSIGVGRRF